MRIATILAALVAFLLLGLSPAYAHSDKDEYKFDINSIEWDAPDVTIQYVYHSSRWKLRKAAPNSAFKRGNVFDAFSLIYKAEGSPTPVLCIIHLVDPEEADFKYQFEFLREHERKHCRYGRWHR